MSDTAPYTFNCPACEESLAVNASMRDALLDKGCVICGAPVTRDDFSKTPSPDSA